MSDHEHDDQCDGEQREESVWRHHSRGCMAAYGVPYDPYADEEGEE